MSVSDYLYIAYLVVAFLGGAIPALIAFIGKAKAKRKAKTEKEKAAIEKEMTEVANGFIVKAEEFYKSLDVLLKQQGESAGPYKKENVMNQLQSFANSKGIAFDVEYWSQKVDSLVKLTKQVNK